MQYRRWTGSMTLCAALCFTMSGAWAFDDSKYPDWKGKWDRVGRPVWLQGSEKPPLTPEYQALFEKNVADQKTGGQGMETSWRCLPPGMPRIMNTFNRVEIVITPATVHILISHIHDNRRIYTDGRSWPQDLEPTFKGYSIGRWLDTDGGGRYDTLEVETRGFKGPREYDTSGLPLHLDNQTIVKEKIYLDKNDRNVLYDEVTTIDDALTRPWTVIKKLARDPSPRPDWDEQTCTEYNPHVYIQGDNYFVGADGLLMPAKKGQPAPDLRYFKQSQK
jgi:hypothetical protein